MWEGRFKSSPIGSNAYLLACYRYMEMNPVFASICEDPAAYPWSNCRSKVAAKTFTWLDADPLYLEVGTTVEERRLCYQGFLRQSISDEEKEFIVGAVRRGQLPAAVPS